MGRLTEAKRKTGRRNAGKGAVKGTAAEAPAGAVATAEEQIPPSAGAKTSGEKKPASGRRKKAVKKVLPPSGMAEDVIGKVAGKEEVVSTAPEEGEAAEEILMKHVTFFLENEEYGLPISQVQEINRVAEITRVPNAPEHVMGVINLRGKIVPVIELKKRLSLGETDIGKESRIVIIEYGSKVLGMLVDMVAQVMDVSSAQIEEAPEEVQTQENFVKGVGKFGERMVILLDLEKVISKEDRSG